MPMSGFGSALGFSSNALCTGAVLLDQLQPRWAAARKLRLHRGVFALAAM